MLLATPVLSCDEQRWLGLTIYHEARNQDLEGKIMVAEVVLNRVEKEAWPDSICGVIRQPNQFPWAAKNVTPNEKEAWDESYELAGAILNGEIGTFNTDATHFINPSMMKRPPRWTKRLEVVAEVGDHVFYRSPSE